MKIQIDLPEELNKKLKIYKVLKNKENLQESIICILKRYLAYIDVEKIMSLKNKKGGKLE